MNIKEILSEIIPKADLQPIQLVSGEALHLRRQQQTPLSLKARHETAPTIGQRGGGCGIRVHIMPQTNQIRLVTIPEFQKGLHVVRLHPVVGVREHDEFSPSMVDACIPCRGQTSVFFVNDPDKCRIRLGIAVAQDAAGVGGTVIDQQDLIIPAGLIQQ